jgi:PAS domain S-box-containing protein
LIVEDEAIVQLHLKRLVEGLGFEVVGAETSGEKALAAAEQSPPDLALVDINIEGNMDGISLARELGQRHRAAIVFVTAFADDDTLEKSRSAGAVGYVVKPFTEQQLRAVLSTAMAEHERITALQSRERALTSALTTVGDAVLLTDADGRVTFLNQLAENLTGWSSADAHGRPLQEIVSLVESGALDLGGRRSAGREDILLRNGTRRTVELEASPLRDADGHQGMAVVMRDASADAGSAVEHDLERVRERIGAQGDFHGMIGQSPQLLEVFRRIEQLAAVDWTVLIDGETGTGKELAARALHELSPRATGPFVAVNCAALTDTLLASQLFGHRRGAFTGAVDDQEGLFEAAGGGTLFLDEIGDISDSMQTSLLRVLDERTVTRVGDTAPRHVDVRVVCASQRDLAAAVARGQFRADLMYRLRAARLTMPPLRERESDLDLLVDDALQRSLQSTGKPIKTIAPDARATLRQYHWPGNVRELRGAIDHAVLTCRGRVIEVSDLPEETTPAESSALPTGERERIVEALRRCDGNRTRAAALLGMSRATLYRRLSEHGFDDTSDS